MGKLDKNVRGSVGVAVLSAASFLSTGCATTEFPESSTLPSIARYLDTRELNLAKDVKKVIRHGEETSKNYYKLLTPNRNADIKPSNAQVLLSSEASELKIPEEYRELFHDREKVFLKQIAVHKLDENISLVSYHVFDGHIFNGRISKDSCSYVVSLPISK